MSGLHPRHILNVLRSDSKGPMEGRKANNVININNPMPRNKCLKAVKESDFLKKYHELKQALKHKC